MYLTVEKNKKFNEQIKILLDDETAHLTKESLIEGNLNVGIAQIEVSGKINAEVEIDCSRCLKPIKSNLDISFKVFYITEEFYTTAKDSELHGEDLEISIYDGEKIDLDELTREQILLNLPTQVFCQENCQGLCHQCGINLNLKKCNCDNKEIDPRWQSLRQLKIKD